LEGGKPTDSKSIAFIGDKTFLVERHLAEMELYVCRHPSSRVVAGLREVKDGLAAAKVLLAKDGE
jgi:hypothetical protein